jgi:hypothetical protein
VPAANGALATACGPLTGPGGEPGGKEPVTLRLVWRATEAEHTTAVRGPVFEQRFPHVKLQFEPSSG